MRFFVSQAGVRSLLHCTVYGLLVDKLLKMYKNGHMKIVTFLALQLYRRAVEYFFLQRCESLCDLSSFSFLHLLPRRHFFSA